MLDRLPGYGRIAAVAIFFGALLVSCSGEEQQTYRDFVRCIERDDFRRDRTARPAWAERVLSLKGRSGNIVIVAFVASDADPDVARVEFEKLASTAGIPNGQVERIDRRVLAWTVPPSDAEYEAVRSCL